MKITFKKPCEHGIIPWMECNKCRKTSLLGISVRTIIPGGPGQKTLELGETLLSDGTVRT
jgi:hypothetical protein